MPEDKKSSTADFLNEIASPEVFKEEPAEIEEKEEKPLPFNQDPKVQRFIEKQVEKRLKDFKPSVERQFIEEVKEDINLPPSFVQLVGNDTEQKKQVLKDLSKYFGDLKGEAKKEAIADFMKDMQEQQQAQAEEDIQTKEELDNYFDEIEETYDVDLTSNATSSKKLRSDFIDYVRKIAHKNEDGEVDSFPDLLSAFETFQDLNKRAPSNRANKELAARGLTRSGDTTTATPTGRSWKDVDRYFSKLKDINN
jgi:hypothetical protein